MPNLWRIPRKHLRSRRLSLGSGTRASSTEKGSAGTGAGIDGCRVRPEAAGYSSSSVKGSARGDIAFRYEASQLDGTLVSRTAIRSHYSLPSMRTMHMLARPRPDRGRDCFSGMALAEASIEKQDVGWGKYERNRERELTGREEDSSSRTRRRRRTERVTFTPHAVEEPTGVNLAIPGFRRHNITEQGLLEGPEGQEECLIGSGESIARRRESFISQTLPAQITKPERNRPAAELLEVSADDLTRLEVEDGQRSRLELLSNVTKKVSANAQVQSRDRPKVHQSFGPEFEIAETLGVKATPADNSSYDKVPHKSIAAEESQTAAWWPPDPLPEPLIEWTEDYPQAVDVIPATTLTNKSSTSSIGPSDLPLEPPAYTMSESTMDEALASQSTWSYSMYRNAQGQEPTRYYCKTREQSERVAQLFLGKKVVGFDIEWKPTLRRGQSGSLRERVSLLQLASEDMVALFHISLHGGNLAEEIFPPKLKQIMESADIIKTGVAISSDATRLQSAFGVQSRALFELSHLHKLITFSEANPELVNRRLVSLATLVDEHLGLPLSKDDNVRSSDWSKPLNLTQIIYAAGDAYAGFVLYNVMDGKRRSMNPTPPLPHYAEEKLPIRLAMSKDSEIGEHTGDGVEDKPLTRRHLASDSNSLRFDGRQNGITKQLPNSINERKTDDDILAARTNKLQLEGSTNEQPSRDNQANVVMLANQWASSFRNPSPEQPATVRYIKTSMSSLRTYALWHNHGMDVTEIATMLRKPPLQKTTVAHYILYSIQQEKLPFDQERLEEVVRTLRLDVLRIRFPGVRRLLGMN